MRYESLNICQVSLKRDNYGNSVNFEKINYLVHEAKNQCKKTINDRKIVHIIIDNYLIDGKNFFYLPNNIKCDFFCVDLRQNVKACQNFVVFLCYYLNLYKLLQKNHFLPH